MSASTEPVDERRTFLAFVERYGEQLTVRDARSLCAEIVYRDESIKVTLTNR